MRRTLKGAGQRPVLSAAQPRSIIRNAPNLRAPVQLVRPAQEETAAAENKLRQDDGRNVLGWPAYFLRWRIFDRMRRFLRPNLRRPLPVFLVPTWGLHG